MLVIGFNWPNFHDNAVAAVLDGKLVYASEEERYTRHKHSPYELPSNALEHCFAFLKSNYGIKPDAVDAYATNFDPKFYGMKSRAWHSFSQISLLKDYSLRNEVATIAYSNVISAITRSITSRLDFTESAKLFIKSIILHMGFQISEDEIKIFPVRHHLAHAASAYYFSGSKTALALVVDGQGETDATTAWSVRNGEFENIYSQDWNSLSMGYLYEYISKYLGFTRLEGPGKVMGLAPYGKTDKKMENRLNSLIVRNAAFMEARKDIVRDSQESMYNQIASEAIASKHPISAYSENGKLNKIACDYAHTLQSFFEKAIIEFSKSMKESSGMKNVVLAGGSALNAKANMEMHYSKLFNSIFIFPGPNDAGAPAGAAAYAYDKLFGGMENKHMQNAYLGDSYSAESIKATVSKSKMKAEFVGEDANPVISEIEKGKAVGFYQGRSELGPRALGNRSIAADPREKSNWEKLNSIKGREWWRPLAPSLLEESMNKYFVDPVKHEFMVMMFHTTQTTAERAPAINHIDMTARPQSVSRKQNKLWYDLIKGFEEDTGEGIIINTSFNNAGEPLVETPEQAIRSFSVSGLDCLYLQGWLIKK
ncbi:carbamoyltransferase [Candidatus Marsarchaeota archaeon]|nr:carbamoyltransferase [Candidatus Marsarchaeota archaeon]